MTSLGHTEVNKRQGQSKDLLLGHIPPTPPHTHTVSQPPSIESQDWREAQASLGISESQGGTFGSSQIENLAGHL